MLVDYHVVAYRKTIIVKKKPANAKYAHILQLSKLFAEYKLIRNN